MEWTWTFTICGREITVALLASSDGTLTWTWNWNWNWSCPDSSSPPGAIGTDSTPGASPTDAGPASPTSEAQSRTVESSASPNDTIDAIAAAISDATQTPFATEPSAAQPIEVTVVAPTPAGTASVQVSVTIPTVVLAHPAAPTVVPNSPAASPPAGTSPITHPSAPPSAKEHAAWFAPTVDANRFRPRTATTEERPLKRPQPPKATVRPAPSRDDTPHRSPVDNPLTLELGGSTAPSGAGALVVLVLVATLTGALVLAAPGLGRRIRSAREPIPRDRYGRRIDLPG